MLLKATLPAYAGSVGRLLRSRPLAGCYMPPEFMELNHG